MVISSLLNSQKLSVYPNPGLVQAEDGAFGFGATGRGGGGAGCGATGISVLVLEAQRAIIDVEETGASLGFFLPRALSIPEGSKGRIQVLGAKDRGLCVYSDIVKDHAFVGESVPLLGVSPLIAPITVPLKTASSIAHLELRIELIGDKRSVHFEEPPSKTGPEAERSVRRREPGRERTREQRDVRGSQQPSIGSLLRWVKGLSFVVEIERD